MSLLEKSKQLISSVEPDGFARYIETYPVEGRVFIRFSTTTDGWADRLCEPFYKRSKVESLLSQCRKEALLEMAVLADAWGEARNPDNGGHALRNYANELRRMAESTMEGEKE